MPDIPQGMRAYLILFIGLFFIKTVVSQQLPDSISVKYKAAITDSDKGRLLSNYLYSLKGTPVEQVRKSMEIHAYFDKKSDSVGADYALLSVARILERISDYPNALKHTYPLLKRFERRNDAYGMMRCLNAIGNALENSQNVENAIVYYKKVLPVARELGDKNHYAYALNNIGAAYAKAKMADSALVYSQKAVNMASEVDDPAFLAYAISSLGESYVAQGEHSIARPFLRKGYEYSKAASDWFAACYACNDLAYSFLATNEMDSARMYAHRALQYSRDGHNLDQSLRAYEYLLRSFENSNQKDSINAYFRLTMTTKDTLFSIEKTRNIQAMDFQEQIRQMEMENERTVAEQERKSNVQYGAIALGLILLASFFILLSRSVIVNEKWISYIGVMGLLAVFEFIDLLIHPYLVKLTHHSPIFMLLVLVGIASILIPIHHRIEKYIKVRVVEKNKKIRLQAAKKTIEKLEKEEAL